MIRTDWRVLPELRIFHVRCTGCGAAMAAYTTSDREADARDAEARAWSAFAGEVARTGCDGCSQARAAWRRARDASSATRT